MTQFAVVNAATREILYGFGRPDPADYAGPPGWQPFPHNGLIYLSWQGPLELGGAPSSAHKYLWIDGAPEWVLSGSLEQCRAVKASAISDACRSSIEAGFICEALGAPFLYPAKAQDQANLVASIADSLLAGGDPEWSTPFWCADVAGAWEFRAHTVEQIQRVGREGKARIIAAMQRNEILQRQVAVAAMEELDAVRW